MAADKTNSRFPVNCKLHRILNHNVPDSRDFYGNEEIHHRRKEGYQPHPAR